MAGFRDRTEAGIELASRLTEYKGRDDVIVLGLPRGGVPVAFEVAQALDVELDVLVVRKLGVPGREELAMGAIAPGGVRVLNRGVVEGLKLSPEQIEHVARVEERVLAERSEVYRGDREPPAIAGRAVIVVDDGLATGASMRAAVSAVHALAPASVTVAVPVAAEETVLDMQLLADEVVCVLVPKVFFAVGSWYKDFSQTTDREVRELLGAQGRRR